MGGQSDIERRTLIKALFGLGVAATGQACTGRRGDLETGPTREVPDAITDSPEPPDATPALPVEEHVHPSDGDRLVFAFGARQGEVIHADDVLLEAPQLFAVLMDADGSHIADGSRLNGIMLVRLDPSELNPETAAISAEGIVAYSAVCTHTGCEISDWDAAAARFQCPCHESEFDPADNGRVVGGPARRRLAALPLRIEDGALVVAGGFTGRIGAEQPWEFE